MLFMRVWHKKGPTNQAFFMILGVNTSSTEDGQTD